MLLVFYDVISHKNVVKAEFLTIYQNKFDTHLIE